MCSSDLCICVCVYPSIRTTYAPSGAAAAPVRPRRANAPTHPRPRAEPGPRAFEGAFGRRLGALRQRDDDDVKQRLLLYILMTACYILYTNDRLLYILMTAIPHRRRCIGRH